MALALICGIAFFQAIQGLFSALIMTILTIISALAAFGYFKPLAIALYPHQPAHADGGALIAVVVITLLVLRLIFDKLIGGNVILGLWADRIGGGVLGLITGMIMVGTLVIAMQLLPFGEKVITFQPYDDTLQRDQSLFPFNCDVFTLGLVKTASAGSLKSMVDFEKDNDDMLLEAYCSRNTAWKNGRTDAAQTALKSAKANLAP